MSVQMQSVGRKGSLSLGNGNSSSSAKTKQPKITDSLDLTDESSTKKNSNSKKFTNGSGNSNSSKTTNDKKTEEKAVVDKEKAAIPKKTPSDDKISQEKKKVVDEKEKNKSKDVKKAASNEGIVKKEEKPKPSTPTLSGRKVNKVETSIQKEEKPKPDEPPKVEEKDNEQPTTTTSKDDETTKLSSSKAKPDTVAAASQSSEDNKKDEGKIKQSPSKIKPDIVAAALQNSDDNKKVDEPMAIEVSTTTPNSTVGEPKLESPRKELQKKQTPEPIMFAEKDLLVSSTPAKPAAEATSLANQKKISLSSDNITVASLSEVKTYPLDRSSCPTSYKTISGRRSLRPMRDYVFQHTNNSLRESYRKINTELDVANESNNTSLNVTVGSEVPNNWSFSFLGRSRKRDRTPTHLDTSETGVNHMDTSPTSPKRPRFDFSGFVGILSSPVTMLRERLARTKIQNTPHKLRTSEEDVSEVANISSVSAEEDEKPAIVKEDEIQIDEEEDIVAIKQQNKENIDVGANQDQPSIGEEALDSDEGETDVRETEPKKKGGCVLM